MFPHHRFTRLLCAVVLFTWTGTSPAATTTNTLFPPEVAARLDADIQSILKQNNLPSAAVGIFVPGRGEYTFADGSANLETHITRTLDQPFRIASITKPFAER